MHRRNRAGRVQHQPGGDRLRLGHQFAYHLTNQSVQVYRAAGTALPLGREHHHEVVQQIVDALTLFGDDAHHLPLGVGVCLVVKHELSGGAHRCQ